MPDKKILKRAQDDARQGKSASTQAGEFVREEIEHVREGKHGARSTKQLIAIGLSKARKAGVKLPPPPQSDAGSKPSKPVRGKRAPVSKTRGRAAILALQHEGHEAASHEELSKHALDSAQSRGNTGRKSAAVSRQKKN